MAEMNWDEPEARLALIKRDVQTRFGQIFLIDDLGIGFPTLDTAKAQAAQRGKLPTTAQRRNAGSAIRRRKLGARHEAV